MVGDLAHRCNLETCTDAKKHIRLLDVRVEEPVIKVFGQALAKECDVRLHDTGRVEAVFLLIGRSIFAVLLLPWSIAMPSTLPLLAGL